MSSDYAGIKRKVEIYQIRYRPKSDLTLDLSPKMLFRVVVSVEE
jgi:hypothetical protein